MLDEVRETIHRHRDPRKHEVHYVIAMLICDMLSDEGPAEREAFLDELKAGTLSTFAVCEANDGLGAAVGSA